MDFLPLALAMNGCFEQPKEEETEITKLFYSLENKIVEQSKILCQKEKLSSDELHALFLCYSTISAMKEKYDLKAQRKSKEKEIKERLSDLMSGYDINS